MNIVFYDFETTGISFPNTIVNSAIKHTNLLNGSVIYEHDEYHSLNWAKLSISSKAITDITEDLLNKSGPFNWSQNYNYLKNITTSNNPDLYYVTYNGITFDNPILAQWMYGINIPGSQVIDLYCVAKELLNPIKDSELDWSLKLTHLRYWVEEKWLMPSIRGLSSHTAKDDITILEYVFKGLLRYHSQLKWNTSLNQIIDEWKLISQKTTTNYTQAKEERSQAVSQGIIPFWKYKGTLISQVPLDYITWCLDNMNNLDGNLRSLLQNEKNTRWKEGVKKTEEYTTSVWNKVVDEDWSIPPKSTYQAKVPLSNEFKQPSRPNMPDIFTSL